MGQQEVYSDKAITRTNVHITDFSPSLLSETIGGLSALSCAAPACMVISLITSPHYSSIGPPTRTCEPVTTHFASSFLSYMSFHIY